MELFLLFFLWQAQSFCHLKRHSSGKLQTLVTVTSRVDMLKQSLEVYELTSVVLSTQNGPFILLQFLPNTSRSITVSLSLLLFGIWDLLWVSLQFWPPSTLDPNYMTCIGTCPRNNLPRDNQPLLRFHDSVSTGVYVVEVYSQKKSTLLGLYSPGPTTPVTHGTTVSYGPRKVE